MTVSVLSPGLMHRPHRHMPVLCYVNRIYGHIGEGPKKAPRETLLYYY